MPVRIVTDSNCDQPAHLVARHNIVVVASVLNLAGQSYYDGVNLSRSEFYRRRPQLNTLPTTAASSAGAFEAAYRSYGAADIIAVHLSSTLGAIFNAARLGAEPLGDQVTPVDSLQVSMGLGWQVLAGAEVAAGGSRAEALAAIRSVQQRVSLLAALDTVEYLRRRPGKPAHGHAGRDVANQASTRVEGRQLGHPGPAAHAAKGARGAGGARPARTSGRSAHRLHGRRPGPGEPPGPARLAAATSSRGRGRHR